MNIQVLINSTDRTDYISWPSFVKEDILNNQVDVCSFETKKYGSRTWKPAVGDGIEVSDDGTIIFAGVIVKVQETIEGNLLKYRVECKDWTHYLDKQLVIERYENQTVAEIITDINTNYLSGFSVNNVNCDIEIESIAFNRISASRCLEILAEQVNFNWYVDYEKDIHFFAKLGEGAPFNLTDTNGKYIFNSLEISDDLSQLRNRVFIQGGEVKGSARTETYAGDGSQTLFKLAHKFSEKPTVTVGGASKTVGVDFLDQDTDFDCLWSYQEKYIRFTTAPADEAAVVISGTPLYPIVAQVQDDESIAEYGDYELSYKNTKISTEEEARQYGASELEAYASKITEAKLETYESGLRSGQTINIQSDIRGISEDFLIQRVTSQMRTPVEGFWMVELATSRTISIIRFLQKLLIDQDREIKIDDDVVLIKNYVDNQSIQATELISKHEPYEDYQEIETEESLLKDPMGAGIAPTFVLAPYIPSSHYDPKREMLMNISSYVYDEIPTSGIGVMVIGSTFTIA
jgi:hypothetical protein